ncbi:hypothetical protein [Phenylobacterium sp.]|uniref:phage protein n=1 Tax=Phenylobacterium sp. TaxID=1871053 RepID=UPI0025D62B83|nr:hypothetical protein [Phenylobacterium sp.]
MSRLYNRKISLIVGDDDAAIDFSSLRISFRVNQWDLLTPNSATLRVWNVSEATALKVQREFLRIVLEAGYADGPFGTVFSGSVVQAKRGRENATDTYLEIVAADGDQAYNFAIINKSLAAGSTPKDHLNALTGAMGEHGVKQGYAPDLPGAALPRGKVMFGMARDHLRALGQSTDTKPSIQNGQLQLVPIGGVIPGPAVVLTAATGMVGIPEQTYAGIQVRCLLNPEIKMGRVVQIDNASINRTNLSVSLQGQLQNAFLPRVADDGLYRVIVVDHWGDTRKDEWYSDLTCIAIGDPVTKMLVDKGYG